MTFRCFRSLAVLSAVVLCLLSGFAPALARAQSSNSSSGRNQSSSSQPVQQEKTPSLVDPAGPTVSLISLEQVFLMAARRLAVAAPQCLVVEDAAAGIQAARRAGMAVLGIGTPAALPGASHIVTDLAHVTVDQLLAMD